MNITRSALLAGIAVAGIAIGIGEAKADIIETYTFTSDHCTDGCLTGQQNGGIITITDNQAGTLSFNVQLANGNQFINGGFDASFGFNLTGNPLITYTSYPSAGFTIPGVLNTNQQNAGILHMDGTGDFEYGLDAKGSGGSDPQGSSLLFSITGTGLDIGDLATNGFGQYFAADIISGSTRFTGAIDASGTPDPVPEPGSLVLLGTALAGLGIFGRRRRKSLMA